MCYEVPLLINYMKDNVFLSKVQSTNIMSAPSLHKQTTNTLNIIENNILTFKCKDDIKTILRTYVKRVAFSFTL